MKMTMTQTMMTGMTIMMITMITIVIMIMIHAMIVKMKMIEKEMEDHKRERSKTVVTRKACCWFKSVFVTE